MAVLSQCFAVLACLCAVIPLTPSAEAAHIYGGHFMEKHASSTNSPQRSHNPSLFGGSTTGHRRHDENQGHQTHDHRAPELPPLLRRYHVHDHQKDHDHQSQKDHDNSNSKAPRSAFARSRYRQEPGSHSRRSSVYVPGEHGNTYLVSRTPLGNWRYAEMDKESSHAYSRRQVDEGNLAFGRIDILSAQSSGGTQRLASLTVDSTPIDWTSGQTSAKAFSLNASTANQTQFIMIPMDDFNAGGSSNKHVTLATEVFDASSAEMVMYCATYDPDPGQASALLMTPCTGTTRPVSQTDDAADPCADDEDDASSSNSHQSQIFSYDPSSGKIEPVSTTENATGVGSSADTSTSCAGVKVRRDTGNSTTGSSATPVSTSTSANPTASAFQQAQNVTLVYVAGALEVPAASPSPSAATTSAMTGASIGQAAIFTTTITTTIVATVTTASGTSSHSATPARAAASVPTPSTTIPTPSVSTTATPSSSSTASMTSASTTPAPAKADESLEVEVVAVTPSTTADVSTTTAAASSSSGASTTTTMATTLTLDAAAVASSVTDQMPHRRRAVVIAGASVSPTV